MARRRYSRRPRRRWSFRRHRKSTQISIPLAISTAMPLVRAGLDAMPNFESGDFIGGFKSFAHNAMGYYTGYFPLDNHFEWQQLINTYVPIGIALAVHKFAGKTVNPQMKRIPFIGKYIGV